MARINAREFERQVKELCASSSIVMRVIVLTESIDHTQLRIFLTDLSFIDVYYHQISGKTAYTQIRDDRRVFGSDNKKGWHWHPYEDLQRHEPADDEITFDNFLKQVEENLSK
jgi:hypothetical protein